MDDRMPHGAAFAIMGLTGALLVLAALFPTAAQAPAFIGLAGSIGMVDRARDKLLWSWAAILFGAALLLALVVSWGQ